MTESTKKFAKLKKCHIDFLMLLLVVSKRNGIFLVSQCIKNSQYFYDTHILFWVMGRYETLAKVSRL